MDIKIYVINLKTSTQRRMAMEEQIKGLQADSEIIEAVDGTSLSKEKIEKYFDIEFFNNRKSYYSLGMVGCTLSHYLLYKKIVKEKIPFALILEDDMVIILPSGSKCDMF